MKRLCRTHYAALTSEAISWCVDRPTRAIPTMLLPRDPLLQPFFSPYSR